MRRPLTLLIALAFASLASVAEGIPVCTDQVPGVSQRCPDWTATYNNSGGAGGNLEDTAFWSAVSPDGSRVFVTGRSRDDATDRDAATVAFSAATGATLWTARYDNGANGYDVGSSVTATNTRVFVTGRSTGADGWDWATHAYDATTGAKLWTDRVVGEQAVDDTSWSVATSPDGGTVYVGGTIDDGAGVPGDALVIAYDAATGARRWEGRFDGGAYDGGLRVFVAPDGSRVFLAGGTRQGSDDVDYLALAFEAADEERLGDVLWSATYASGQGYDTPKGAALSPDGTRLALTGNGTSDVNTVVFDTANGNRVWSARYNGTRNAADSAGGVAIAANRVVVAMTGAEGNAGFDFTTRGYDLATGAVAWTMSEGTPATPDTSYAITALGNAVYVTGSVIVPRGEIQPIFKIEPGMLLTASYDAASGARRWVTHHNHSGVGSDVAVAISSGGGRVYPTGTFVPSGVYVYPVVEAKAYAWDYGVIAYDA